MQQLHPIRPKKKYRMGLKTANFNHFWPFLAIFHKFPKPNPVFFINCIWLTCIVLFPMLQGNVHEFLAHYTYQKPKKMAKKSYFQPFFLSEYTRLAWAISFPRYEYLIKHFQYIRPFKHLQNWLLIFSYWLNCSLFMHK